MFDSESLDIRGDPKKMIFFILTLIAAYNDRLTFNGTSNHSNPPFPWYCSFSLCKDLRFQRVKRCFLSFAIVDCSMFTDGCNAEFARDNFKDVSMLGQIYHLDWDRFNEKKIFGDSLGTDGSHRFLLFECIFVVVMILSFMFLPYCLADV